jgi:hypothetical protein
MSEELGRYLSEYIQNRVGVMTKYLLAAFENKDCSIWVLEASEGTSLPSSDFKNLQLLRDAQIFTEQFRISRNGRNTYRIYKLTDLGKKFAEKVKAECTLSESCDVPSELRHH